MKQLKTWISQNRSGVTVTLVILFLTLAMLLIPRPQYPEVNAQRLALDPSLGPADAPVTIIEYADYACESCKAWHEARVRDIILEKFPDQVRYIWRDNARISTASLQAAAAGQCALDQGKFWEYQDRLFANEISFSSDGFQTYADQVGLDMEQFSACISENLYINKVKHSMKLAGEHGFSFTPAFLVNEQVIIGPPSAEYLSTLIEDLLAQ